MKAKVIKLYTKLISLALVLLGFSACDSGDEPDDFVVMYGVGPQQYSKLDVSGKIVVSSDKDSEEIPIKGIRLIMMPSSPNLADDKIPANVRDTAYTDEKGAFKINGDKLYYYYSTNQIKIKIEDVDGDKNGLFENKEEILKVDKKDYIKETSPESPAYYVASKEMGTIKLTPKEDSETEGKE